MIKRRIPRNTRNKNKITSMEKKKRRWNSILGLRTMSFDVKD